MDNQTKFIVVSGGVISGIGKGVTSASIGRICKEYGFKTTLIKIDPYINFDAGTLRPTEHGEVWVTDDGGEIDQDLGTYERFIDETLSKKNSITTGQIYKAVIDRERAGGYLGQTVQFVPHITDEVIKRVQEAAVGYDIAVVEIGGTIGDYENIPYLFAFKRLERMYGSQAIVHILVSYLPVPEHIGEMKTKPTQQAVRQLGQHGIFPDFIVCRTTQALDDERKEKIVSASHVLRDCIISAPDVKSVYEVPLIFEQQNLSKKLFKKLSLTPSIKKDVSWHTWANAVQVLTRSERIVRVGIVGKYVDSGDFDFTDSYLSIIHALRHAGVTCNVRVEPVWLNAKDCVNQEVLTTCDALIVPGGFGNKGVDGKLYAISYARKNNIPFLGICYGLQLAVVEYARNVCGLHDAQTTEIDIQALTPIIDMLPLQKNLLKDNRYGGTMRLGAYCAKLDKNSLIYNIYEKYAKENLEQKDTGSFVTERHRHRYEVNPDYISTLQDNGLVVSGEHKREDDTRLVEFIELPDHKYFVATQAHPEFNSRLFKAHPLFVGLIKNAQ